MENKNAQKPKNNQPTALALCSLIGVPVTITTTSLTPVFGKYLRLRHRGVFTKVVKICDKGLEVLEVSHSDEQIKNRFAFLERSNGTAMQIPLATINRISLGYV